MTYYFYEDNIPSATDCREAGSHLFTEEDPEPEMIRKIIKSLESSRFTCSLTSEISQYLHFIEKQEVQVFKLSMTYGFTRNFNLFNYCIVVVYH